MAEQLSLVRGYDFEADQGTVVLIGGTADGFDVAYQGWTPNTTPDKKGMVQEALTLRVQGTSTDNIATSLQKLADKAEETQRYFANGARDYAVWFRVQLKDESKGRQSLVYNVQHEPASSVYDYAMRQVYHLNQYTLGITRAPWWEGTACGTITGATVNTCGGTLTFGTVKGDLPARMAQVKITNLGTQAIFPSGNLWMGVKSSKYGPAGSFVPYWSIGGTIYDSTGWIQGSASGSTADATAKGGTARFYEAGPIGTAYFMWGVAAHAVTSNPAHLRGDYRVLLRAKTGGSGQYLVQMKTGWKEDYYELGETGIVRFPSSKTFPRVSITNNSWQYYEMGDVSIPPSTHFLSQATLQTFSLLLYAERVSGTVYLYFDGFVLIPRECFMYAGYSGNTSLGTAGVSMYAVQSPNNVVQAATMGSVITGAGTVASWVGQNIPVFSGGIDPGTASMVVVAAEGGSNNIATNVAVEIKYFERWKEIRGND